MTLTQPPTVQIPAGEAFTAELVSAPPAPGPGARIQRTAGQAGGVLVFLELVLAFEWLGSAGWSQREAAAVTAVAFFVAATGQNLVNWLAQRRR